MIEKTKLKKKLPFEKTDTFKNNENNKSWDKDNQAWWDWYVSLADNTDSNKKDGLVKIPEPVKTKYPSKNELKEHLSSPFNISKDNIKNFQKNGFIKLKNVLTPYAVQALRNEILSLLTKTFKNYDKSKKNRFLSLEMMWLENALIKEFVLSPRIAKICADSLPPEYPFDVYGGPRQIKQSDFDERVDILPVADPNIMSMAQRVTLAQTQLQIASSNPQLHNIHEAYRRVYEALGTKQIETLLKPPQRQPEPMDPAKENARALQMKLLTAFEFQDHDAHIAAHTAFMESRMVQINPQVYALLQSHVSDHISFKARKEVTEQMMQDPNLVALQQNDPQSFQIAFDNAVATAVAEITSELVKGEMQANMAKNDPLVRIKQQEVDLRAMDMQRKAEEVQFKQAQENQRAADRLEFDYDRLATQDQQSDERLEVAREKIDQKKG